MNKHLMTTGLAAIVLLVAAYLIMPWHVFSPAPKESPKQWGEMSGEMSEQKEATLEYSRGVNDALDAAALLSLVLDLQGRRKTWGEISDTVRVQLSVKQNVKTTRKNLSEWYIEEPK